MQIGRLTEQNIPEETPYRQLSSGSNLSWSKIGIITLLFTSLFFPFSSAATSSQNTIVWKCPKLEGSYLDSCMSIDSEPYFTVDPNLSDVQFCKYTVKCQKIGKSTYDQTNTKYVSAEFVKCAGQYAENCDGKLVFNPDLTRRCKTEAEIEKRLRDEL